MTWWLWQISKATNLAPFVLFRTCINYSFLLQGPVCRDIQCDQIRYLSFDGKCNLKPEYKDPLCYVMFMKMTLTKADFVQIRLEDMALLVLAMCRNQTGVINTESYIPETPSHAEYIIFKVVMDDPAFALELLAAPNNMLFNMRVGLSFHLELVSYNISLFNDQSKVEIPNSNFTHKEFLKKLEIPSAELPENVGACTNKESIPVDKLLECPFIELENTDLPMSILDGSLFFEETGVKPFSHLQYRKANNSILICLK